MYRVLYRKWRPRVFEDVVGQPQVTKPLLAQLREDRLSHAYLFVGSRGTGKTTCAKILAKAVNCLQPVNGDPCNQCPICRGIDEGTVLDITEMDAASNRGIDDIRQLRDVVQFTPSQARYRVYIVDEVHMLTPESFNALLKTLEEPPAHVIFILATTEVHKLPATILSRCQRFDFHRIAVETIAERLMWVARQEGARLEQDAAVLIARIADGGMRDALSLLDRAMGMADTVTADVVAASAGLMSRAYIYDLLEAIAARDAAKSLTILDSLHKASCDTERLSVELTEQFRGFLMIKTAARPEDLIACTAEEMDRLRALAARFTTEEVFSALRVLSEATQAIKRTQNRRVEAEMAIIRLCTPESQISVEGLLARISALERTVAELKAGGLPAAASVTPAPARAEAPSVLPPRRETPAAQTGPSEPAPEKTSVPGAEEPLPFGEASPPAQPSRCGTPPEEAPLPFGEASPSAQPSLFDPPPEEALPFGEASPSAQPSLFDPSPEEAPLPFGEASPPEQTSLFDPPTVRSEPLPFDGPPQKTASSGGTSAFSGFANEPTGPAMQDRFAGGKKGDGDIDYDRLLVRYGKTDQGGNGPSDASAPEPPPTPQPSEGEPVPRQLWVKIQLAAEQAQPSFTGILTNSTAAVRGDVLYIRLRDKKLKLFLDEKLLSRVLLPHAKRLLGGDYTLRIE